MFAKDYNRQKQNLGWHQGKGPLSPIGVGVPYRAPLIISYFEQGLFPYPFPIGHRGALEGAPMFRLCPLGVTRAGRFYFIEIYLLDIFNQFQKSLILCLMFTDSNTDDQVYSSLFTDSNTDDQVYSSLFTDSITLISKQISIIRIIQD